MALLRHGRKPCDHWCRRRHAIGRKCAVDVGEQCPIERSTWLHRLRFLSLSLGIVRRHHLRAWVLYREEERVGPSFRRKPESILTTPLDSGLRRSDDGNAPRTWNAGTYNRSPTNFRLENQAKSTRCTALSKATTKRSTSSCPIGVDRAPRPSFETMIPASSRPRCRPRSRASATGPLGILR